MVENFANVSFYISVMKSEAVSMYMDRQLYSYTVFLKAMLTILSCAIL